MVFSGGTQLLVDVGEEGADYNGDDDHRHIKTAGRLRNIQDKMSRLPTGTSYNCQEKA